MEVEAGMLFQPGADLLLLMGGVVIDDAVYVEVFRRAAVDGLKEFQKLLMAMALHALANDFPFQHIQGGEKRGGAIGRRGD